MNRRTLLVGSMIVSMLVSLPPVFGQTKSKSGSGKSAAAEQAVRQRSREYVDALTKRDVGTLEKIWADGYTFINPQGQLVTKAQRIANVTSGATEFQAIKPQNERLEVMGNVALDIGTVTLQGTKYSGQESSGEYRYMNVWRKTGNDWQIVANQITLIKK